MEKERETGVERMRERERDVQRKTVTGIKRGERERESVMEKER